MTFKNSATPTHSVKTRLYKHKEVLLIISWTTHNYHNKIHVHVLLKKKKKIDQFQHIHVLEFSLTQ